MADDQTFNLKVGDLIQYSMSEGVGFFIVLLDITLYSPNNSDFMVDPKSDYYRIETLALNENLPTTIRTLTNVLDKVYRDGKEIFYSARVRTTVR